MSSSCLDAVQLDELAGGLLADSAAAPIRAHLAGCPQCRERFEECRENQAYLQDMGAALRAQQAAGPGTVPPRRIDAPEWLDLHGDESESQQVPGYRIIREIHRGGQGAVYEAVQLSTQRTVALKMLLEGPCSGERARWRFEREVKLIAAMRHPNIVVIHDSGITQGRYYFAMDYVRGQPLDTHVRLSGCSIREAVRLFRQIAEAVAYAHRRGVIHRDLKPSNILVHENSIPCVLDFGLAKNIGDDISHSHAGAVSLAGHLMGTVRYMSPEQTLGDPDAVDVRTDVYTLGVILYELLTGWPPYPASQDLAVAFKHIRQTEPPRPSRIRRGIHSDLDTLMLKAMAKEPERRYQSAGELAEDLSAWLDGRPIAAKSTSSLYVIRKLAVRHVFASSVLLALVATIIGFSACLLWLYQRERQNASNLSVAGQEVVAMSRSLARERDEVRAAMQEQMLGWFLAEYEGGRLERAREIREEMAAESSGETVAAFLLDSTMTPQQLRGRLGPTAEALAEFAVGERAMVEGSREQAVRSFRSSIASPQGSPWVQAAAESRLRILENIGASATAEVRP